MAYSISYRPIVVNPQRIDPRVHEAAKAYVRDFMSKRINEIRPYPPPPPHSRYRRTGKLFAGWFLDISETGGTYTVIASNVAHDMREYYMSKVQGPGQIPMHAITGWERIDENVVNHRAMFQSDVQRIYDRAIRRGP